MSESGQAPRFFVPQLADAAGVEGLLTLGPTEGHHAAHVLRVKAEQAVEVFDGQGRRALADVLSVRRGEVALRLRQVPVAERRGEPVVHLAFAVPKGNRLDWLLEKAAELGAASLQPVIFQRSVAGASQLTEAKRQRWLGHCVSAAKQCGLNFLPAIHPPAELGQVLAAGPSAIRLAGDLCDRAGSLTAALADWTAGREVRVLVGPEGGFAQAEHQAIHQAGWRAVRLGQTTLRIETAALSLLAGVLATCR